LSQSRATLATTKKIVSKSNKTGIMKLKTKKGRDYGNDLSHTSRGDLVNRSPTTSWRRVRAGILHDSADRASTEAATDGARRRGDALAGALFGRIHA
jgi:hypothetical protein